MLRQPLVVRKAICKPSAKHTAWTDIRCPSRAALSELACLTETLVVQSTVRAARPVLLRTGRFKAGELAHAHRYKTVPQPSSFSLGKGANRHERTYGPTGAGASGRRSGRLSPQCGQGLVTVRRLPERAK